MKKRPHSASRDKYLTKSPEYLYSPYKSKNVFNESLDQKILSIHSSIDRLLYSINKLANLMKQSIS